MSAALHDLIRHWRSVGAPPPLDLSRDAAMLRARLLLEGAPNRECEAFVVRNDLDKSCLYAVVGTVFQEIFARDPRAAIDRAMAIRLLNSVLWTDDPMGELDDLKERLCIDEYLESGFRPPVPYRICSDFDREAARQILDLSVEERSRLATNLRLEEPETLLALCQLIDRQMESSPLKSRDDARWAFELLRSDSSRSFLFDEREYYLGELCLLVGTAARFLGEQDDARKWFDRSETWFLLTVNAPGDIARIAYQRLAVKMEQREFEEVIILARPLREAFLRSGGRESALKCRYLEAICLKESDRLSESLDILEAVVEEAKALDSSRILSPALVSIIQIHSLLGDTEKAFALTLKASPILRESNNAVSLAKLQWGLANLLRQTGQFPDAIAALRAAQQEFIHLGLRADVGAIHLVVADILLETGQERQAEWEIRAALPILDELKMVPEGFAALSLLRESLRRRFIDRQALRNLHGYFEDLSS